MATTPFFWQNNLLWQTSIEAMAKNLPPSGATLNLLNLGAIETLNALRTLRPDISPISDSLDTIADESVDAIIAHGVYHLETSPAAFLQGCYRLLRPGGRLILVEPSDEYPPRAALGVVTANFLTARSLYQWHHVAPRRFSLELIAEELQANGFERILCEHVMKGWAVLARGEKPHAEETTPLDRINVVAQSSEETGLLQGDNLLSVKGKYLHLLIRQVPNKPVWRIEADEVIRWYSTTVSSNGETAFIAFTSLPKAVSFMQNAILQNVLSDVHKVAKFAKATLAAWDFPILINPTLEIVQHNYRIADFIEIDPATAESPDE